MSRRIAWAAVPLVLVIATLAACTEPARIPPAEPPSATAPLFASDDEALEAATAAYEEYLRIIDSKLSQPVEDPTAFRDVASGSALDEAQESLETFLREGYRVSGSRVITAATLQQRVPLEGSEEVRIYLCESVAGLDLLDREGNSLVQPGRPDVTALEVAVVVTSAGSLVSERSIWVGGGLCDA